MTKYKKRALIRPSFRNDLDCVLQLAREELDRRKPDAGHSEDYAIDYRDCKAALERVVQSLQTAHIVIARREG